MLRQVSVAGRLALIDGQWRIATGRVANQLLGIDD
jgi:hypothetical protein